MNPSLPKGSFYPFRSLIRPMPRPDWYFAGGWSAGWERVTEFLERLRQEPITSGFGPALPHLLLPDHKIAAMATACQRLGQLAEDADDTQLALVVMRAIAQLRPFSMADADRDPVLNLRAIMYAGAFIARHHHAQHCHMCPLGGRHCGEGAFCSRYTVEQFFDRRPALSDPRRASAQLDDMREWSDEDFLRLVRMTTLSVHGCSHYTRSRVVK